MIRDRTEKNTLKGYLKIILMKIGLTMVLKIRNKMLHSCFETGYRSHGLPVILKKLICTGTLAALSTKPLIAKIPIYFGCISNSWLTTSLKAEFSLTPLAYRNLNFFP